MVLDSGCPEFVVQRDEWLVAEVGDEWFEGLLPDSPLTYPPWEELQR